MFTFSVDSAVLNEAFNAARRVAGIKPGDQMMIVSDGGAVAFAPARGTALPTVFATVGGVSPDGEPGGAIFRRANFDAVVGALPDGPMVVTVADDGIAITAGGATARVEAKALESAPAIPALSGGDTVPYAPLGRVSYAVGTDSTLPMLTVIRVEPGRAMATDRFRLGIADCDYSGDPVNVPGTLAKFAVSVKRPVLCVDGRARVELAGGGHVSERLYDDSFPRVDSLIPREHAGRAVLDRASLLAALKLAKKRLSSVHNKHVVIDFGGRLIAEDLSFDFVVSGAAGHLPNMGFNPVYLESIVKAIPGESIPVGVVDSGRPALFYGADASHLLMPVRLPGAAGAPAKGSKRDAVATADDMRALAAAPSKPAKSKPSKSRAAKPKPAASKPAPVEVAPVEVAPADPASVEPVLTIEYRGRSLSAPAPVWEELIAPVCGWLAMHEATWFETLQAATGGRLRRAVTKLEATGRFTVTPVPAAA